MAGAGVAGGHRGQSLRAGVGFGACTRGVHMQVCFEMKDGQRDEQKQAQAGVNNELLDATSTA